MVGGSERNLGGESFVDRAGRLVDAIRTCSWAYVKLNNHAISTGASSMCDKKCGIALQGARRVASHLSSAASDWKDQRAVEQATLCGFEAIKRSAK